VARARLGLVASLAAAFGLPALAPGAQAQVSFSGPTNYPAGDGPHSVAVGDFDADSDPDLAVANNGRLDDSVPDDVSILLGDGTGGFTGPTNFPAGHRLFSGDRSVVVDDFDADSDLDLAVANLGSSDDVSILLGDGTGGFTGPTNFAPGGGPESVDGPKSVAVADFDADSDPDLAVANNYSHTVSILLGDGAGSFSAPTNFTAGAGPASVAVGDFDADSNPDLAVANAASDNVSILLNTTRAGRAHTEHERTHEKGRRLSAPPLFKASSFES
jgi:hypothetical protein